MPDILGSYLRHARGESERVSVWSILDVLGALIGPLVTMRNALYDRGILCRLDPPLPVISVGNLCNGGTNKTPMVDMLARRLTKYGFSVGIVSRGYGGKVKAPLWVGQDGESSARSLTGDEPLMLANRLPDVKVVVSPDRYEGVRYLKELGADVVVADDAFQHRRMGRDIDIVLIDATCPFGNGKLFPSGILRERLDALSRADIVILTKTEQVGEEIDDIRKILYEWISPESVFTAKVEVESWMEMTGGGLSEYVPGGGRVVPDGKFISFSAIGNPQSFYRSLLSMGLDMVENCVFRDHHMFDWSDIDSLERMAYQREATAFICTEKDLQNMPPNPSLLYPLYIPRIGVSIDEEERFWKAATSILKPKLIVASNGYGEDAMGSLLAAKLKDRFPEADVSAFALVGVGREYLNRGIDVISPESEMPSAGIVKYSLKALLGDFRHGLKKLIKKQIEVWRTRQGKFRTPICVGDVYLMAHTLWGQGISPILVATAKSVKLRGHWLAERFLMRRRAERVWTRDEETACDLSRSGIDAVFRGNPIMDLAVESDEGDDPWEGMNHPHVMLLPGSRPRAYQDTPMLMKAVRLISEKIRCGFIMVVAPTIDMHTLLSETDYHIDRRGRLALGDAEVAVYTGPISSVAYGADLLIGLGGTANQVSSGLGVPVISVIERGKLVQKKLLGDSEILTQPDASALADKAVELLGDPVKRLAMSRAGIEIMGGAGALSSVTEYAADELGWDARCKLFRTLEKIWFAQEWQCAGETGDHSAREEKLGWKIPDHLASKVMKLVKIIK